MPFTVQAASGSRRLTGGLVTVATLTPADSHVQPRRGSGEATVSDGSDNVVTVNSRPTLTFSYKALTALSDVILVINQPDGWLGRYNASKC